MAIVNMPDYAGTEFEGRLAERVAEWERDKQRRAAEEAAKAWPAVDDDSELRDAPPADETLVVGGE